MNKTVFNGITFYVRNHVQTNCDDVVFYASGVYICC